MSDPALAEFPMPRMYESACSGGCGEHVTSFVDPSVTGSKPARCAKCTDDEEVRRARTARLFALERSIPTAYDWATLDADLRGARTDQRKRAVRAHASTGFITFIGHAGAGKTTLAVAMLRERARATGEGGLFAHAHRVEQARRRHGLGDGDASEVEAAIRAPVLLLDDVGFGEVQRRGSPVADVIQERHAAKRPTWCTTGLGLDHATARAAVAELYGDGTARRMFDREEGVTVLDVAKPASAIAQRDLKPENFDARKRAAGDNS